MTILYTLLVLHVTMLSTTITSLYDLTIELFTGFTMEIPIPKLVQYLCQYAQITDFASCTVIGNYSNTSSFSFKIP